jgi:hypothetical protein
MSILASPLHFIAFHLLQQESIGSHVLPILCSIQINYIFLIILSLQSASAMEFVKKDLAEYTCTMQTDTRTVAHVVKEGIKVGHLPLLFCLPHSTQVVYHTPYGTLSHN